MEENMQCFQNSVLYYFKKGKSTTETQKKICAVYREGTVTDQMCQKWFAKCLGSIDQIILCCLIHPKMFSSSPGLSPLEANSGR